MKHITTFTLLIITGAFLSAQEYSFDPSSKAYQLTLGNDVFYNLELVTDDGPAYTHLKLNSAQGSMLDFGLNGDDGIGGEIRIAGSSFTERVVLNNDYLNFIEGEDAVYMVSREDGFQAFDNSGNMTVQIRGDVSGDGRVSTNELEITGGSDLSEHFDIKKRAEEILPGMLVSISGTQGKLAITDSKRDDKIVGVISGANGIETGMLMGQKGSIADGDYPVALTGRTYVYANTENGPIEPGDFITSSSTAGYGMRVKNKRKSQGAIIGKAMTALASGSGYVLVLVNLQ